MKRIGVITYWNSLDNYGQILQCYALQKYLISEGYDAFLIKYAPENKDTLIKKIKRNLSVRKILYFFSTERKAQKEIEKIAELEDQKAKELAKQCRFDEFRSKYIRSTSIIYRTIDQLRTSPPEADFYICGSDQVWNNSLYEKNTAGWFLDFGSVKRISYAASIGRDYDLKEQKIFAKYLKKISYVSVREESALACCKKNGRDDALITIDPTILYGDNTYKELIDVGMDKENSLFIYSLNIEKLSELHWPEIEKLSEKEGMEIKVCCSSGYIMARDFIPGHSNEHLTIQEWLSAIKQSKFVITSSFHGTVFCLLMHVPFVSIPLSGRFSRANDRIRGLLRTVGLEERFLEKNRKIERIYLTKIDWENVDLMLRSERIKSAEFLRGALNGV